jgi:hypothetical protein
LHDFPLSIAHTDRKGRDQSFIDIAISIGTTGDAVLAIARGTIGEEAHRIDELRLRWGQEENSTRFDYRGAALLHGSHELLLQPFLIADRLVGRAIIDLRVVKTRMLCGRMIAPDCHTVIWGGLRPKIVFDRIAAARDKLFGGADRRELIGVSRLLGRVVFFRI